MASATTDRFFFFALAASLAGHAVVLGAQLLSSGWGALADVAKPLQLIYEQEPKAHEARWASEALERSDDQLKDLPGPSSQPLHTALAERHQWGGGPRDVIASEFATAEPQIRVGTESASGLPASAFTQEDWASAIDLTNVTTASQGNPILLNYFSAIREQIQRTANGRTWLSNGTTEEGVVYVGFDIRHTGDVQGVAVVPERSVTSPTLREVALHIIQSSSPFPPFPPSLDAPTKTVVVPIEFAHGS